MKRVSAARLREAFTAAALFLATAAFTLWQNSRVAVLWDLSYLLDSSLRIAQGQLPYRDFPFAHAPLTFLLHALIIRVLGRVYYPHVLCAAVEAGLATILTWRVLLTVLATTPSAHQLSRPTSDGLRLKADSSQLTAAQQIGLSPQLSSQLAAILAAPLTLTGIYAIYPHPIYDSDCILAVLLALYLLLRAGDNRIRNALAGAACVVPLFTKQNIGLPFLSITLLAVALIAFFRRRNRASIAPQLSLLAGAATTLAAALLLIRLTVGLHNYLFWTFTFAAQRRLPGLSLILQTYRQPSLLWTLPAAALGLILLHRTRSPRATTPGAPFRSQTHRDMGGVRRLAAILLLAAPFLWTLLFFAFSSDADDRADQLLSLWPYLLLLAAAFALWRLRPSCLRAHPTLLTVLPLILLATIHGTFLSQQLWGSTYALWPLLLLLIAAMLTAIPAIARPLSIVVSATFLLCGGLYAASHERLSYIHLEGPESHATLPALRGLTTPGPWIPDFEDLVRFANANIPSSDSILLLPGDDPFYFATGRTPQFPILLFDPATDPYTPQQTAAEARARNIRWLIVTRDLQLTELPQPDLPEVFAALQQDFTLYRTLPNYDIYRRKD